MTTRILKRGAVLEILGVTPSTLYRWIRRSGFPRPLKLGPRAVGWREDEVSAWIDSRERGGSDGET